MSFKNFKWTEEYKRENFEIESFFANHGINEDLAKILKRRGITTEEKLCHFLYDDLSSLSDPFLMKGMENAVDRVIKAIRNNEKIVVFGDYDVDGITSTSILYRFLSSEKANVDFYIPKREQEGYGLNANAIKILAEKGFSLLITVDCGISSTDLIAEAPASLDIIVTDHHTPPENLPQCVAVINPHQVDCPYPFKELAGCGVAFSLCRAIYKKLYNEDYTENIELAALGTIADVVSLTGENRVLVKEGMKRFTNTKIKGLKALLKAAHVLKDEKDRITKADLISFGLAPRLNAAGRIADAALGVHLLITENQEEAVDLAENLCEINVSRQQIEREIYEQAVKRVEQLNIMNDMAIVVDGENWHPGVIGIVASRLMEKYHRPVLVLTIRDGVGKGSCRSLASFDIYKALSACKDCLLQFGGHKMAAGFSIEAKNIPLFRKKLNEYAREVLQVEDCVPVLEIEDSIPLGHVNLEFIKSLSILEPCGCDNPRPIFESPSLFVETAKRIGSDSRHFKCRVSNCGEAVDAIFWGIGEEDPCRVGDWITLVYEPEIHEWFGEQVQLICKDAKQENGCELSREFLVLVYKKLTDILHDSPRTVREIQDILSGRIDCNREKMLAALSVFEELNILNRFSRGGEDYYRRRLITEKLDLFSSSIYRKYHC